MCGIVVSLPVYDAVDGRVSVDAEGLAALLPDVPVADPLESGIPDAALLAEWEKALAYAADQFRSPAATRLVGDPATDRTAIRVRLDRLAEWTGGLDPALVGPPPGLDVTAIQGPA